MCGEVDGRVYTLVANPRRDYFVVCRLQKEEEKSLEKVAVVRLGAGESEKVKEWGMRRSECLFK